MTENKRFHIINGAENLVKYGIYCKPVLVDEETGKQYVLALDLMDILNELYEENKELKQALLFYLDLAVQDSSYLNDGFEKGMELWCQRLFNCTYEQAKEYKDFEWADVWEMGE